MNHIIGADLYVESAKKFCAWIEGPAMSPDSGVKAAIKLLSHLYNEALHLPRANSCEETIMSLPVASDKEIDRMRDRFKELPIESYLVTHPLSNDNKLTRYCPFETFAFVYKYTRAGLDLYESGKRDDAMTHWRHGFRHQWGTQITAFIYTLHTYANQNDLL